jgi:hypothetical protein
MYVRLASDHVRTYNMHVLPVRLSRLCFTAFGTVRAYAQLLHIYTQVTKGMPVVVMASFLSGRRTRRHSARVERRACHAMKSCRVRCKDDDDDERVTSF